MTRPKFDPQYVQISEPEVAEILGITIEDVESRRKSDDSFPEGFKDSTNWMNPIRFRLSDIYKYSKFIMATAKPAPKDRETNKE